MGIRIYHNLAAIAADRFLESNRSSVEKSIEKLSSGLRINRASDDAAGLTISEKLRAQVRGLNRASMNAQDGISMLNIAEGALSEVHSILQRMRELAVQAANDTLTQTDRGEIQKELEQLKQEINRIAGSTEFNTKKLLNGSATALVSTDSPNQLGVIVRDVVREGNYRVEKQHIPSTAHVLKSDIFNLVSNDKNPNGTVGQVSAFTTRDPIFGGIGEQFRAEDLTDFQNFEWSQDIGGHNNLRQDFRVVLDVADAAGDDQFYVVDHAFSSAGGKAGFAVQITGGGPSTGDSGYYELEVTAVLANEGTIEAAGGSTALLEVTARRFSPNGIVLDTQSVRVTHAQAQAAADLLGSAGAGFVTAGATAVTLGDAGTRYQVGDKLLFVINAAEDHGDVVASPMYVQQSAQDVNDDGFYYDGTGTSVANDTKADRVGLRTSVGNELASVDGRTFGTSLMYYDREGNRQTGTGNVRYGEAGWTVGSTGHTDFHMVESTLAQRTTQLRNTDKFQGLFDLGARIITVYTANGNKTSIVLNGTDTLEQVAAKFRDGMLKPVLDGGLGLGVDGNYDRRTGVDANLAIFVSSGFVNSDEAVAGTLVFRSTLVGREGRLAFSADQEILDAFSLATIQQPDDPMTVRISDAHTGELIGTGSTDDGVLRNIIQGVDLIQDARSDLDVRFLSSQRILDVGDIVEGGSGPTNPTLASDIIAGSETFARTSFANFQGLQADVGSVGSPLNQVADFELTTYDNATMAADQFNVVDYRFMDGTQAKDGFLVGVATIDSANNSTPSEGYYELEVVSIDGVSTAGTNIALGAANAIDLDSIGNGHVMGLMARVSDRTGTLMEEAYLEVGDGANAGAGISSIGAQQYFGDNYADGHLTTSAVDVTGGDSATVTLGQAGDTYSVGDKIMFALADRSGDSVAVLRDDTTDLGFVAGTAPDLFYDIQASGNAGSADGGISDISNSALTSAGVRTGLAEEVAAGADFANTAGSVVNVTLGYYNGDTFRVGGGAVTLGHSGDTIQEGSVQFSLTEMELGPRYVFESAPGAQVEYIHVVDNRTVLHIGANKDQVLALGIGTMDTKALGVDSVIVVSQQLAEEAIERADAALNIVSSERAKLGAYVNRLEHTINVLDIQSENLLAAESRIRDLDMAQATIEFTRNQILMNAGMALLAQANTLPQAVLQLLRG